MKYLFLVLGIFFAKAQNEKADPKLIFELAVSTDFSSTIKKQNPAIGFGVWYRYPVEGEARLELGGNLKSGAIFYNFVYGKNGDVYKVNSKGYILNLGGRMVREFTLKNQKIEWLSELTFNNLFFDGTGIPDDSIRETESINSVHIVIDAESISTLQFGQGIRIWKGNLGFGLKAGFTPYRLWYKSTVPHRFNVISAEAILSYKL